MKTVNLDYLLKKYDGTDNGDAWEVAAIQMAGYIRRMTAIGETEIVADMTDARSQFESVKEAAMTDNQFDTVYNWLINFSGFYGQALTQLTNSFDNAQIS